MSGAPIIEPTEVENIVAAARRYEHAQNEAIRTAKELTIHKESLVVKEKANEEAKASLEKASQAIRTLALKIR